MPNSSTCRIRIFASCMRRCSMRWRMARPNDRGDVLARIEARRQLERWERAVALIRKARLWPVLEDAAIDDAREAFAQALHLHRSAGTLHKELKAAEMALATEPTDENYRHLVEIQAQFRDVQATEALIEGFGIPSGRAGAEFLSI